MASRRALRGILVTTHAETRAVVQAFLRDHPEELVLGLDLDVPFREFGAEHVKDVRNAAPAILLLDLDENPEIGISLVRHLVETAPELVVVAIGDVATTDLLLNAMRAGVAEFLPKPVTNTSLVELVARVRARMGRSGIDEGVESGQIHVFFSPKGGSGSTTAAVNYAIELHRRTGRPTLLVDLEPELGEASLLLGMNPKFNFVDLIQNFHRIDQGLLSSYIERHTSGINLLSAPYQPEAVPTLTEEQVRKVLGYLRNQYAYLVVDASKSFGPATLAAFEAADRVFLLATVDLPSLRNMQRALPLVKRVTPAGDQHMHVVINRFDPAGEIQVGDIEKSLQMPVFATLANDYDSVISSINSSRPVILNGKSSYARSIRQLVDRVIGDMTETGEAQRGFLQRITGMFRAPAGASRKEG